MPISSKSLLRSTSVFLLIGFIALMGIVAVNFWLGERAQSDFDDAISARDTRIAAVELRNAVQTAEASQRGFLLTGNEIYLAPYQAAKIQARRRVPQGPADEWSYESSEEDWGQTCFVSTRVGDVKVGFMASPGKDLIGYVDGLFQGDVSATWKVDDKISRVSEGGVNDYFGWHEFGDLGGEMLTAMTTGQQLTISTPAGKRIAVGLRGASAAITSFQHCVGKGG